MFKKIKQANAIAPVATVIFAVSLVLALGFTTRLAIDAFDGPRQKATQVEEWMTPRFISRNWKIPPDVMRGFLGIKKPAGRPKNLLQIAESQGIDVLELIEDLETNIREFDQNRVRK